MLCTLEDYLPEYGDHPPAGEDDEEAAGYGVAHKRAHLWPEMGLTLIIICFKNISYICKVFNLLICTQNQSIFQKILI